MKKSNFLRGFFILLGIGISMNMQAQGQDANFQWNGNPVTSVVDQTSEDLGTIFLYNVSTGRYLNTGSGWGTSIVANTIGMRIKIQTGSISGKYKMQGPLTTPEGNYIAFGRRRDTSGKDNLINYNRVYVDRGSMYDGQINGIINWTLEETASGSNTYYIYCDNDETTEGMGGKVYISVEPSATSKVLNAKYPIGAPDANSQWKIVTLKDMKDAFKEQFASNEEPADATFLIADQNFERSNVYVERWVTTGFTKSMDVQYRFAPEQPYTFFVGMGAISSNMYQAYYGSYWIGSVRNAGNNSSIANGTMTQTVTALKKGWYRVSCDGFYNADGSSSISSSLFANVTGATAGNSNVSTHLNIFNNEFSYDLTSLTKRYADTDLNTESPYVKAAKLFETGIYNNSILVYVPAANSQLNIGIKVENSTGTLDWTAFDNFQLKYCGDNDLILDEEQTSKDYIDKQVNANNANTLILKRTLKPGIWSSITLPVELTAAQFKTAFGDQAKLSKLVGQDPNRMYRIKFTSVDLTNDDAVVIEPNKLYIMKSTRSAGVTEGSYSKIIEQGRTITVQAPYFVINNVVLKQAPVEVFKETSTTSTTSDNKLQFCGTQIYQTSSYVPASSYVLGANDGKWYFTQSSLPIKGFRCWIATGNDALAKQLTFMIDDEEEAGIITGIEGVIMANDKEISGTVYNINGQVVRRNASTLEGLPKGIYIVNNKKYIIK